MTNPFDELPTSVLSKPGPQENPFKVSRQELGMTQAQVASAVGVTTQVVQQLEQGLYSSPPASLVAYLSEPGSERVMRLNYFSWVNQKRHSHEHLFRPVDLKLAGKTPWSSLKHQVSGKSNRGFCLALVYQPSLIREFEKYGRGFAGILRALRECGLEDDNIVRLQEFYIT